MRLINRPSPRPRKLRKPTPMSAPDPSPKRPRKQKVKPPLHGDGFTLTSALATATGESGSYALDQIRVLPGPKSGKVVLQASDGHQAVCLVAPGTIDQAATLPRLLVKNFRTAEPLQVRRDPKGWTSSNGQTVPAAACEHFPRVAEALPKFSVRREGDDHFALGLDVSLLTKISDGLGTSKIALLIPKPDAGESTLTKPIAVCPATKPTKDAPHGVAVIMPYKPEQGVKYYRRVRRDIVAAETPITPGIPAPGHGHGPGKCGDAKSES